MSIQLTILGYNSALPTKNSHPSAQVLSIASRTFLIDCGEGTQVQLRRAGIKFSSINQIFISHLHGDHVFGLVGLISSFQLLGRTKKLDIFGPKGIKDFIMNQLKHTGSYSSFELNFVELTQESPQLVFEDKKVTVKSIPLKHRITTFGYRFDEKTKPKHLNINAVKKHPEIEVCDYQNIKNGKDVVLDTGEFIPNDELTYPASKPLSYAYCSDTRYAPDIVPLIKNVNLLYHESTFLSDHKALAKETGHSTAEQAASIAKEAAVAHLIIGHFSNRYRNYEDFLAEAQGIFENTYLPKTLATFVLHEDGTLLVKRSEKQQVSAN